MQVNSLGLTEQQPENNAYRILIEMLSVVLSRNARARAVQLPAWNEALGLPRPFDQQWSLRLQQIMAYETDLLEYGDLFDGSAEIAAKVEALKAEARAELAAIDAMGGAVKAIESGYLKGKLVESNTRRLEAIERGEQIVVGVNSFTETEPSPLTAGEGLILHALRRRPRPSRSRGCRRGAPTRDERARRARRCGLCARRPASGENIMPASIEAAKAGVTTGEWGAALRGEFGEYRAPTGVAPQARQGADDLDELRARGAAGVAEARAAAEVSRRQARPRRPFQRRRADRGARHRRRHGRRLRRHPPDARRDRRARQGRRPLRRPVDPVGHRMSR